MEHFKFTFGEIVILFLLLLIWFYFFAVNMKSAFEVQTLRMGGAPSRLVHMDIYKSEPTCHFINLVDRICGKFLIFTHLIHRPHTQPWAYINAEVKFPH